MWTIFALTPSRIALITRGTMATTREAELLSAAGYLCSAADNLRAVGLSGLADEIERYLRVLEVEVFLDTVVRSVRR